jgi:hypothetical protein
MVTDPDAWNADNPFPTEKGPPRFERPKPGDPSRGTLREPRQGRFPVAVAVETAVPETWHDSPDAKPARVRVAVIGHGGPFLGTSLNPLQEKLLLDTCNWLLGRDDRLARDRDDDGNPIPEWRYPRVALSDQENLLWQWGARLGLPVLFVFLGMVVWMVRHTL